MSQGSPAERSVTSFDVLAPLSSGSLPFWEAAQDERLELPRCDRCHRLIAYPRSFCPRCGWDAVTWERVSTPGVVYTYTVIHQSRSPEWQAEVPYISGIVELEPGARLTTLIVDCEPADVRVGMPVTVTFRTRVDGIKVPVFRPLSSAET